MRRGWYAKLEPAPSAVLKGRITRMMPLAVPTVFVIDDDALVRAAIQGMLKSVGLRSKTFGTPQEFLRSKRPEL